MSQVKVWVFVSESGKKTLKRLEICYSVDEKIEFLVANNITSAYHRLQIISYIVRFQML